MYNTILILILCLLILNRSFFNLLYNIKMEFKFNKQNKDLSNRFCSKCFYPLEVKNKIFIGNYFCPGISKRYYIIKVKCENCGNIKDIIMKY